MTLSSQDRGSLGRRPVDFYYNHTPTTEIYTLSLHDALPIQRQSSSLEQAVPLLRDSNDGLIETVKVLDRKSTRLNSSQRTMSYAVFCLKKKKSMIPTKHRVRQEKISIMYLLTIAKP